MLEAKVCLCVESVDHLQSYFWRMTNSCDTKIPLPMVHVVSIKILNFHHLSMIILLKNEYFYTFKQIYLSKSWIWSESRMKQFKSHQWLRMLACRITAVDGWVKRFLCSLKEMSVTFMAFLMIPENLILKTNLRRNPPCRCSYLSTVW